MRGDEALSLRSRVNRKIRSHGGGGGTRVGEERGRGGEGGLARG